MKLRLRSLLSWRALVIVAMTPLIFAAACGNDPTSPGGSGGSCQIITGVTTTSFAAAGGTANISVGAASGCAWTAVSSAAFLTVASGASGTGDGTVQFNVAANTGVARTAILTITGSPITISQSGVAQ